MKRKNIIEPANSEDYGVNIWVDSDTNYELWVSWDADLRWFNLVGYDVSSLIGMKLASRGRLIGE